MPSEPSALRDLSRWLEERAPAAWLRDGHPGRELLARTRERLRRDLLPRTAGAHRHLVVGIVGPNNAGKSSIFNAVVAGARSGAPVVGRPEDLSPARATGGATRRLVGAAAPELSVRLMGEPTLAGFAMAAADSGFDPTADAPPGLAHELQLMGIDGLPESLLVVDTPDFDSVFRRNRDVTDALLTVCDLVVAVVTRHTYQNHDVVEFLREWLASGRPWALVYNESVDAATTAQHAEKLAEDIGAPPEAVFHAAFDPEIAEGRAALVPRGLGNGSPGVHPQPEDCTLSNWLCTLGESESFKERALASSLASLAGDLGELRSLAAAEIAGARDVRRRLSAFAEPLGRAVAGEAMPMGPFLQAFRDVLDERPTLVQRELRRGLKWTSARISSGARSMKSLLGLGGAEAPSEDSKVEQTLLEAERRELGRRWVGAAEVFLQDAREAFRRGDHPPAVAAALANWRSGGQELRDALRRTEEELGLDPDLLVEYQVVCRDLIAAELDAGRSEWALQLAVDGMHLLPLGVAGIVIAQTGGLGADLAVAGGGAMSAALAERLSRLLGTSVAGTARSRWVALRSQRIAAAAIKGLGGASLERVDEVHQQHSTFLHELETLGGSPEKADSGGGDRG